MFGIGQNITSNRFLFYFSISSCIIIKREYITTKGGYMSKYIIAMTINAKHISYAKDVKEVLKFFKQWKNEYIEIVKHGKTELTKEHYHILLFSGYSPNWWKEQKVGHIEKVRNVKAYQKYMNNHDKEDSIIIGELPYVENNDDDMIIYLCKYGPVRTVQLYGFKALRMYGQIKNFSEDYDEYKQWHWENGEEVK